jgi:hypothetical protein
VSGTTTPPATTTTTQATTVPASSEPTWAKPSIGVYTLTLFVGCLALAAVTKNELMGSLIVGAVIAKFGTVVDYYFGSSSGSTKKTDIMANATPVGGISSTAPSVVHTETVSSSTATPVPTPAPTPRPTPPPTPGPLTP